MQEDSSHSIITHSEQESQQICSQFRSEQHEPYHSEGGEDDWDGELTAQFIDNIPFVYERVNSLYNEEVVWEKDRRSQLPLPVPWWQVYPEGPPEPEI